jgi:hypothetical protein
MCSCPHTAPPMHLATCSMLMPCHLCCCLLLQLRRTSHVDASGSQSASLMAPIVCSERALDSGKGSSTGGSACYVFHLQRKQPHCAGAGGTAAARCRAAPSEIAASRPRLHREGDAATMQVGAIGTTVRCTQVQTAAVVVDLVPMLSSTDNDTCQNVIARMSSLLTPARHSQSHFITEGDHVAAGHEQMVPVVPPD